MTMREILAAHHERIAAGLGERLAASRQTGARGGLEAFVAAIREGWQAADATGVTLPDEALAERFGLSALDVALLWVAAIQDLDPGLEDQVARANDDVRRGRIDVALAMRLFAEDRLDLIAITGALSPSSKLLEKGLVELVPPLPRASRMRHFIVLPDHVLPYLNGLRTLSPAARPYCRWVAPAFDVDRVVLPREVKEDLLPLLGNFFARPTPATGWLGPGGMDAPVGLAVMLTGTDGSGRTTAIKAVAGTLGRHVVLVDGAQLALAPAEARAQCMRDVLREAELFGDIVCVRRASKLVVGDSPVAHLLAHELARRAVAIVLCGHDVDQLAGPLEALMLLRVRLPATPSAEVARTLWMLNFPMGLATPDDVDFGALAERIQLSPLQMRKASQLAYWLEPSDPDGAGEDGAGDDSAARPLPIHGPTLERASKAQVSRAIGNLAVVSDPHLGFGDLILDEETEARLRAIIAAWRNRRVILDEWGLGQRITRGTGVTALFDGDPGTGKTHAAEVIASELHLSLVRVNVASVVDKYIGETEKNLTRIFEEARPDMSLLLFDEADSLFSKRTTNVEKAVDRYSNMDIAVLLQLIERYPGLVVLTTNLKQSIDKAFERRFSFKIQFKLPGPSERERIWRFLLPPHIATAAPVDYGHIAGLELSGGEIKNAILSAAFDAALAGKRLDTGLLYEAGCREAAAAGRIVRRIDRG